MDISKKNKNHEYYLLRDGQQFGPYSIDDLKGILDPDDMVWRDGIDWMEAHKLTELRSILPAPVSGAQNQSQRHDSFNPSNSHYESAVALVIANKYEQAKAELNKIPVEDAKALELRANIDSAIKKKKLRIQIPVILLFLILTAVVIIDKQNKSNTSSSSNAQTTDQSTTEPPTNQGLGMSQSQPKSSTATVRLTPQQGQTAMTNYYLALNSNTMDAYRFFDSNVDQFIGKKNITPGEINTIVAGNTEFTDRIAAFYPETFQPAYERDGISYFEYWIYFTCYRVSKAKNQECRVRIEVGFTPTGLIKSYVEKEVKDLKFTDPGAASGGVYSSYALIIDPPSNVRSCGSTSCDVVAECSVKNERIKILSINGNWALIETNEGVQGYLHNSQFIMEK
jgi:hypothetical protein